MAKIGRPTKYDPKYCEELIAHMSDPLSPCSFDSFAGRIGISRDTIYEWVKVHKDFSDAKKVAEARGIYTREDRYNLLSIGLRRDPENPKNLIPVPTVHQSMIIFGQKNQSGWRDKIEMSGYEEVDELEWVG